MSHYKTALYYRLSRDDDEAGESNSIASQRLILRKYAGDHDLAIVDEYIDDGWSGTNFDRPAFQRLLKDIEAKKINCVLTKDLSRLGRNYIQVGQYTDYYFPQRNVRYIAVNDSVDTFEGDNEIAPFKNILNEWYARDTSRKVRSALRARFEEGLYMGSVAPLGYKKDPAHKGHLIVDPASAWIVRKMFAMASSGMGVPSITRRLTEEQIPTPGEISLQHGETSFSRLNSQPKENRKWSIGTVRQILTNRAYVGDAVHYKRSTRSYKDKRQVINPEDKCFIVEGTHEPLIERSVFDEVQAGLKARLRPRKNKSMLVYTGFLRCATCGHRLVFAPSSKTPDIGHGGYSCPTRSLYGKTACTRHYIRYDALDSYVLSRLQYWCGFIQDHEDKFLAAVLKATGDSQKQQSATIELNKTTSRLDELDRNIVKLYEDRLNGTIADRTFDMLIEKFESEQKQLSAKLDDLREKASQQHQAETDITQWVQLVKSFTRPTEVTRPLLQAMVEKIVVHECEKPRAKKHRVQKVEIYYRFGNLDQLD